MKRLVFAVCIYLLGLLSSPVFAQKLKIIASIFPLAEIAQEIGGEEAEVRLLLPPGADPHSWEPTPKDILNLKKADLLLAVGGGLEPWLEDILAGLKAQDLKILLAAGEKGHHHEHLHGRDPHVWLDFLKDAELSLLLAETLAKIYPQKASYFRKRGQIAAQKFKKLHQTFAQTLQTCRFRVVPLAGHDAFRAWEKNYHLEFVTLAGQSPEAEPTPQALKKIIFLLRRLGLKAIYYDEPQALRFAKIIARESGAKVYFLTPGASLTKEELEEKISFFSLMERNLKNLSLGLECRLTKTGQN